MVGFKSTYYSSIFASSFFPSIKLIKINQTLSVNSTFSEMHTSDRSLHDKSSTIFQLKVKSSEWMITAHSVFIMTASNLPPCLQVWTLSILRNPPKKVLTLFTAPCTLFASDLHLTPLHFTRPITSDVRNALSDNSQTVFSIAFGRCRHRHAVN